MSTNEPTASSRREVLALSLGAGALAACSSAQARVEGAAPRRPELDELFRDLRDQRSTCSPIQPHEHAARRQRLGRILAESKVDAYLCEGGATMSYLSGVSWGHSERTFALLVLA